MFCLKSFFERRRQRKQETNNACDSYIARIDNAFKVADEQLKDRSQYVDVVFVDVWVAKTRNLHQELTKFNPRTLRRAQHYRGLLSKIKEFDCFPKQLKTTILKHNAEVLKNKISAARQIIGEVEGRELDEQQMQCIVESASNHLVIAGAGTGKTTTIIGKIKYLIKSHQYQPAEILALSFTNASASEMAERIELEVGEHIDAMTFHKLGLCILGEVEGKKPNITSINLHSFIKEQITELKQDSQYLRKLNRYFMYGNTPAKSSFDFSTQEEYEEYLQDNPPITLKGEAVKSYGEMDISNFLFENQIKYIYEHPYKIDTRDAEHGQYHPDFYLPDYQIYIEYFGIDRQHKVPDYFKSQNGEDASKAYCESMEWKRSLHKDNHTTMIECFAYEKFEDRLLENLQKKLEKAAVQLTPMDAEELWDRVCHDGSSSSFSNFITLIETFINHLKSNNFTISEIRQKNHSPVNANLLDIIEPIYDRYDSYLTVHNEIDFNDMINKAASYVRQGKYHNKYKFVIVDEYQDISKSRYNLLDSLRNSANYKLFCVGDDWQSIYGFSGSDINLILNFESYWGPSVISKIETTYRFPPQLAEISSDFVTQNPAQIQKQIRSEKASETSAFGIIQGYTEAWALKFMLNKLDDLPKNSEVFLIGRYNFDVGMLDTQDFLRHHYDRKTGLVTVRYLKRSDLYINFLTAHKSKGLQADYVFIINNKKGKTGFPSKIQDAAILSLLLDNRDDYPYAEERRLFYVALTRAKEKAFLVTVQGQESEFVKALQEEYTSEIKHEQFECPRCGGKLVRRRSQYGEFYGCSNYYTMGCRYIRNIRNIKAKTNNPPCNYL